MSIVSLPEVKASAKRLSKHLEAQGIKLKHTHALEAVAAMLGYRNFHVLNARCRKMGHDLLSEVDADREIHAARAEAEIPEIISGVFQDNHAVPGAVNPDGVFISLFGEFQAIDEDYCWDYAKGLAGTLGERTERPLNPINARGRTQREILGALAGHECRTTEEAWQSARYQLRHEPTVHVLTGLSRSKLRRAGDFARGLLKILDDAHFDQVRPLGDLVFVDRPSFMEREGPQIRPYVRHIMFDREARTAYLGGQGDRTTAGK